MVVEVVVAVVVVVLVVVLVLVVVAMVVVAVVVVVRKGVRTLCEYCRVCTLTTRRCDLDPRDNHMS